MSQSKYAKYIVTEPIREAIAHGGETAMPPEKVTGRTAPLAQYLNNRLVSNCGLFQLCCWVWEVPNTNPWTEHHSHTSDEILIFAGSDPNNIEDLGGEVEIQLGDEIHKIDKTATIFIPKGLPHAPIFFKRVDRPFLFIAIGLQGEYE